MCSLGWLKLLFCFVIIEKRKEGDSIFYSKSKKARRGGIFPTPVSCFKRKKKRQVNKLILKLPPNVNFDQGNKRTLLSIKRHHKAYNKKQGLPYSIWFLPPESYFLETAIFNSFRHFLVFPSIVLSNMFLDFHPPPHFRHILTSYDSRGEFKFYMLYTLAHIWQFSIWHFTSFGFITTQNLCWFASVNTVNDCSQLSLRVCSKYISFHVQCFVFPGVNHLGTFAQIFRGLSLSPPTSCYILLREGKHMKSPAGNLSLLWHERWCPMSSML